MSRKTNAEKEAERKKERILFHETKLRDLIHKSNLSRLETCWNCIFSYLADDTHTDSNGEVFPRYKRMCSIERDEVLSENPPSAKCVDRAQHICKHYQRRGESYTKIEKELIRDYNQIYEMSW